MKKKRFNYKFMRSVKFGHRWYTGAFLLNKSSFNLFGMSKQEQRFLFWLKRSIRTFNLATKIKQPSDTMIENPIPGLLLENWKQEFDLFKRKLLTTSKHCSFRLFYVIGKSQDTEWNEIRVKFHTDPAPIKKKHFYQEKNEQKG